MSTAAEHIAGWETAGLLDHATADRLRAAEPSHDDLVADTPPDTVATRSAASRLFGPGVTIAEVFGYLGGGFLIAAWSAFIVTTASAATDVETTIGLLSLLAAAVLTGIAWRMRRGDERASRAAGVLLLVALGYVGGAAFAFIFGSGVEWPASGVIGSAAVLLAAVVYRLLHPSVLTQLGVLASITSLAGALLMWLQMTVFPTDVSEATGQVTTSGPDPIVLVLASAAWWLIVAVGIGLVGLFEARHAARPGDPTAANRAAVTRFWAGLVAVIGLAVSVSQSHFTAGGDYVRVLEPIVGDVALLILSAILVERAFRRDATSYIYAAALGLIVALTDFNVSYLSDTTAVALLVEGVILLGVGVAADRLRRQVGEGGSTALSGPPVGSPPDSGLDANAPDPAIAPEPAVTAAEGA